MAKRLLSAASPDAGYWPRADSSRGLEVSRALVLPTFRTARSRAATNIQAHHRLYRYPPIAQHPGELLKWRETFNRRWLTDKGA